MLHLSVSLLVLVAAQAPAPEAALWEAAFALTTPSQAPKAESTLKEAGLEGYGVLSRMARSLGTDAAIQAAALELHCPLMGMMGPFGSSSPRSAPGIAAARLATRLLSSDPTLRASALASGVPFDRALVLTALAGDAETLLSTLASLEHEESSLVLTTIDKVVQCVGMKSRPKEALAKSLQEARTRFSKRLRDLLPQQRCASPEGLTGELQNQVASGDWKLFGWGSNNEDFSLSVDTGQGSRLQLSATCALALYDALVSRGVYLSELVVPLSTLASVPVDVQREAGARAVRDLEHFPENERNRRAAELVNAGYAVPQQVVVSKDTFSQELQLEAAARQKQPGAVKAIEQHIFCRGTFGGAGLSLLGFVPTRESADTAWQLASRCPLALQTATAALVRREDARALGLLEKALDPHNRGFGAEDLTRALLEHYTRTVDQKLRKLAEAGSSPARELVQRHEERARTP